MTDIANPTEAPAGPPVPAWASLISKPTEALGNPRSILLYGKPGTRKTSLVGQLIKRAGVNKITILDIDNGTEVFVNDPEVFAAVQDGRIQIIPLSKTDPNSFFTASQIIMDAAVNDYGIDYLVIDTLNVLQEVAVAYLTATTVNSEGKIDTRAAWGEVAKWTDQMARAVHDSPHVTGIFVLHEKDDVADSGSTTVLPKLQGSMKDSIASIPSVVARLSWKRKKDADPNDPDGTELVASLGGSDKDVSKNRYSLPNEMRDFSLLKIYETLDAKRSA